METADQERKTLRVDGMDCGSCATKVETGLKKLAGVQDVEVSVPAGKVKVTYTENTRAEDIARRIGELGYKVQEESSVPAGPRSFWREPATWTTGIAGIFVLLGFIMKLASLPSSAQDTVFAAAILVGGLPIFRKAWLAVRNGFALDMNVLMTVAAMGAAGIGAWAEAAVVVLLFAIGEVLESYAMDRARNSIRSLMDLTPKKARILRGANEIEIPVEEVGIGDVVIIRPGERLPADGEVVNGLSTVDQAPITGESMPVLKETGSEVFAGTINGEGTLEVRATREYSETTISRVIRLVEEAQESKAPAQRFIDRFARYYTPTVVTLAALVFLVPPLTLGGSWSEWFYRALVLLVIACPCALVISTPVSVVSALAGAARSGALIKGGAYLETMGKVKAVALDKTGTLTEGSPRVTDVIPLNGTSKDQALALAASLENRSQHPLGKALVAAAREAGLKTGYVEDFNSITGLGVRGRIEGQEYLAGSPRLFEKSWIPTDEVRGHVEALSGAGKTAILLVTSDEVLAVFGIADTLRSEARESLAALKASGVQEVVMLTGDNEGAARTIASELGIDYRAELRPGDKLEIVKELQKKYGPVAMVGDGINDAPALAAADVGIAMGAAGTDTAIETADVALMSDNLSHVSETINRGRRAMQVIWQNVTFSIGVKILFLGLATLGTANLWMAIFADTGASLLVIANGLRLLKKG